tara:strand:- start:3995 stop:4729 length:735 start_codon:yes stop_codon:yes gene_type:complete
MSTIRSGRRFFVNEFVAIDGVVTLDEELSHRIRHVMRLRDGDLVELTDGLGVALCGRVDLSTKMVTCSVETMTTSAQEDTKLMVAVPLLKAGNTELVIQKMVELGVASIHVFRASRSVPRISSRTFNRLQKVTIEAMEQSGRVFLPRLKLCESLQKVLVDLPSVTMFGDFDGQDVAEVLDVMSSINSIGIVVGPEGGLTESEISLLRDVGALPVSLGNYTLRSETAVIVMTTLSTIYCDRKSYP